MFRRRTSGGPEIAADLAATSAEQASRGRTAAKGRPTPKRREAEPRRPAIGSQSPTRGASGGKASGRGSSPSRRAASREQYAANMAAMRRGDQRAMRAADRGPVKQMARDYVDTRRVLLSEWVVFGLGALLVFVVVASLTNGKSASSGALLSSGLILTTEVVILLIVILEGLYHGWRVTQLVRQRYPGESTRGLTLYVAKRNLRIRGTRVPPPREGLTRGGPF